MPGQVACIPCRERHLKCDGQKPVCRRCLAEGSKCHYAPSRRGQRRRPIRPASRLPSIDASAGDPSPPTPSVPLATPGTSAASSSSASQQQTARPPQHQQQQQQPSWPVNVVEPPPPQPQHVLKPEPSIPAGGLDSALTDLYYATFHHCHPVLVPKYAYQSMRLPESLRAVVRFIGSIISPFTPEASYKEAAASHLKADASWSPFRVQALLLFSVALHATNDEAEAHAMLSSAVDLANLLGMNRYAFAEANAGGQQLLEESFRRTWWELFCVEGMMAALDQRSTFRCNTVELEVALPCEDPDFNNGSWLPKAPTLSQFDNRLFDDDEEVPYSSYCYRIEAVRLLSRVLAIAEDDNVEKDSFTEVDNALAGWKYHLPPCKADIARTTNGGEVDELMFQAHLIINNATIMLHLPRSNLQTIHPLTTPTSCCPWSRPLAPTFTSQNHLMKVTAASQGLSDLAALRSAHEHTPLLACGLILGALVQLSICSLHASNCITQHRERVMLMIGVLKSLGRIWPLAKRGLVQVRIYAKEVLQRPATNAACASVAQETPMEPDPTTMGEESTAADIDFAPIDISWIDELAHQQPLPVFPQQQSHGHGHGHGQGQHGHQGHGQHAHVLGSPTQTTTGLGPAAAAGVTTPMGFDAFASFYDDSAAGFK